MGARESDIWAEEIVFDLSPKGQVSQPGNVLCGLNFSLMMIMTLVMMVMIVCDNNGGGGNGAGQGPARSLLLCLDSQAKGWLNPVWSLDPGTSGIAVGGVKGDVLGIPEPQHLLFCPLQLLEMSFNCLEDVESTIPVSPLHLAVSPRSFPLAFPVPTRPRPAHRYQHV